MDSAGHRFVWGTEMVRRSDGIPFLVYERRRQHAAELLDDVRHWDGRVKDLIIRGGENIAAPHVENVLLRHPAIRDVAVCGRPDADLGEIVAAAVVVDPASPVTVPELRAFAAEHLAYFEVPTSWWLRTDPLPSNDVGKVDKRRLLTDWPPDD